MSSGPRSSARRRWGTLQTAIVAVVAVLGAIGLLVVFVGRDGPAAGTDGPAAATGENIRGTWPTEPPTRICGNEDLLGRGPTEPPPGAVVVPAGDNTALDPAFSERQNTTFWFAPGLHTIGNDRYDQIVPGDGNTFVGAPGAVIDGQRLNQHAFSGEAKKVTIAYLTIRNFDSGLDEGAVNHNDGSGWTVEYSTITENGGAGLMAGAPDNTYRYNCIKDNGQYGINACCGTEQEPVTGLVLDHNEITGNNTGDWESVDGGCGCTGGVKFWINSDVTITNNWVHDNRGSGLWLDNNNSGFLIERNLIENNDAHAIFLEAGYDTQIRNNTFRRNAIVKGREFRNSDTDFPTTAIYVSENGSPDGYGLTAVPTVISYNNFEDNWGGVSLWENPDRYCSSSVHTHPPYCTVKVDLYDDSQCAAAVEDVIPAEIGDKYRCRWSTENNVVEHNVFRIDKSAVGEGCQGEDYCGLNGIFSNVGSLPEFSGFEIPWRITYQQGNVFRDNRYIGDWKFAGFEMAKPDGGRVRWDEWTAPAPEMPTNIVEGYRPETFGQDQGSIYDP